MALSDAGWQIKIAKELGRYDETDPASGRLVAHEQQEDFLADVASLWDEYADKTGRLRYLYTKRHACEILQGRAWEGVDFTDADVTEKVNQESDNLQQIYKNTLAEIERLEKRRMQATSARVGAILAVVEHPADSTRPDPNARYYKGHPLYRTAPLPASGSPSGWQEN